MQEISKRLNSLESQLIFTKEILNNIILNLLKILMILKSKTDRTHELISIIDNIEMELKKYEQKDFLIQNIPEYKPLNLSIHTSVKTPNDIANRIKILKSQNGSVSKWLKELESREKPNIFTI
jgi:hypothetical protein